MIEVISWAVFAGCVVAAFISPIIGIIFVGQWVWNLVFERGSKKPQADD